MANPDTQRDRQRSTKPPQKQRTSPPDFPTGGANTDLLFRVLLDVQKTLGELSASVRALTDATKEQAQRLEKNTIALATLTQSVETSGEKADEHAEKLDKVRDQIAKAKGALWLLGGLITLLTLLAAWLRLFWHPAAIP